MGNRRFRQRNPWDTRRKQRDGQVAASAPCWTANSHTPAASATHEAANAHTLAANATCWTAPPHPRPPSLLEPTSAWPDAAPLSHEADPLWELLTSCFTWSETWQIFHRLSMAQFDVLTLVLMQEQRKGVYGELEEWVPEIGIRVKLCHAVRKLDSDFLVRACPVLACLGP